MPQYSPYDARMQVEPHETYTALRTGCPVCHNPKLDFWALFRYADVQAASRDWESFTSTSGSFLESELEAMREFMPPDGKFQDMDPPRWVADEMTAGAKAAIEWKANVTGPSAATHL